MPTISTTRYERSHGKKPRGEGLWAFDCEGYVSGPDGRERFEKTIFTPVSMTLADAKRWVKHHAPNGTVDIHVGS